jgi:hypothetical protein
MKVMANRNSTQQAQISGARKDEFIHKLLREIDDIDAGLAARIAQHLSEVIQIIKADRSIIEQFKRPRFDPNGFSVLKVYRTSGEIGLRRRLNEICESRQLQEIAKAQQISLPRNLKGEKVDPSEIRNAIVRGVVKRIADWEAAS